MGGGAPACSAAGINPAVGFLLQPLAWPVDFRSSAPHHNPPFLELATTWWLSFKFMVSSLDARTQIGANQAQANADPAKSKASRVNRK